jgi:hypothetical protein
LPFFFTETFPHPRYRNWYHKTCITVWYTHSMLVPRSLLICWSTTRWWRCTILSILAHVSGSIMWGEWLRHARPCSYNVWTSCTSQTLLYSGNIHHRTHASFENKCLLVLHLLHTETAWHSAVRAWTNPCMSSTE